jgi:hypothetical protein
MNGRLVIPHGMIDPKQVWRLILNGILMIKEHSMPSTILRRFIKPTTETLLID